MQQSFEYMRVQTALDSITVENVGAVTLLASNDIGFEWVLDIKTDLGYSTIKEFGPIFRDDEITKAGFSYNRSKMDYNEGKLCKTISTFLNMPKREITQVMEIDEDTLNEKISLAKNIL